MKVRKAPFNNNAVRASIWTIFAFGFSKLLRLFSNLILTRLLIPEVFGLMTIVTVIRIGVYMCSEIGLKVSVIRHEKGEKPEFINTAWTLQVIRGVILWVIISLIALVIAKLQLMGFFPEDSVYGAKDLPIVIIVTGLSAIILGFESSNVWLAQRYLTLGKVTRIELLSQLLGICVMVFWATKEPTVWAIVVGSLVSALSKVILSHSVLDGKRNYFYWDGKIALELLHFGKWLFLSAIITFVALNGDRLLLGGFLTAEELGVYTVAFFLASSLSDAISQLNSKVSYPLLSKAHRKNSLRQSYYSIRLVLDCFLFFIAGLLMTTAPLIVELLYDQRYASAGSIMQILVISLFAINYRLANFLFLAVNKPFVNTIAVSIKALFLWSAVPLLFLEYGLQGAIWGIAVSALFDIPVFLYFMVKYKFISWYKEFLYTPLILVGYYLGDWIVFQMGKV